MDTRNPETKDLGSLIPEVAGDKPETKDLGSLIPEVSEDKPGTHLGSPKQKTPKKVKNIRSRKPDTRSLKRKSKSKDLRRQLLYIRFRNKTT